MFQPAATSAKPLQRSRHAGIFWFGFLTTCCSICCALGCDFVTGGNDGNPNPTPSPAVPPVVRRTVTQVEEGVNSLVSANGQAVLTLTSKIEISSCYAPILLADGNRPGLLQIQSYKLPSAETFPSFYLIAEFSGTPESLVDSTLDADLFVQAETGAAPWSSLPDQPVQVRIVSVDDAKIVAEFAGGRVINSLTKEQVTPVGKLTAIREQAG